MTKAKVEEFMDKNAAIYVPAIFKLSEENSNSRFEKLNQCLDFFDPSKNPNGALTQGSLRASDRFPIGYLLSEKNEEIAGHLFEDYSLIECFLIAACCPKVDLRDIGDGQTVAIHSFQYGFPFNTLPIITKLSDEALGFLNRLCTLFVQDKKSAVDYLKALAICTNCPGHVAQIGEIMRSHLGDDWAYVDFNEMTVSLTCDENFVWISLDHGHIGNVSEGVKTLSEEILDWTKNEILDLGNFDQIGQAFFAEEDLLEANEADDSGVNLIKAFVTDLFSVHPGDLVFDKALQLIEHHCNWSFSEDRNWSINFVEALIDGFKRYGQGVPDWTRYIAYEHAATTEKFEASPHVECIDTLIDFSVYPAINLFPVKVVEKFFSDPMNRFSFTGFEKFTTDRLIAPVLNSCLVRDDKINKVAMNRLLKLYQSIPNLTEMLEKISEKPEDKKMQDWLDSKNLPYCTSVVGAATYPSTSEMSEDKVLTLMIGLTMLGFSGLAVDHKLRTPAELISDNLSRDKWNSYLKATIMLKHNPILADKGTQQ